MKTEEFIKHAKDLRTNVVNAEFAFLSFLMKGEGDEEMWRSTGAVSFDGFLESTNLCDSTRYRNFCAGFVAAPDIAESVGVEGVVAAGKFHTKEARRDLMQELKVSAETNGVPPSARSVATVAHDLRTRIAARSSGHRSYAKLLADYERVCRERDDLKRQIELLRSQVKSFRSASRKAS